MYFSVTEAHVNSDHRSSSRPPRYADEITDDSFLFTKKETADTIVDLRGRNFFFYIFAANYLGSKISIKAIVQSRQMHSQNNLQ